VGGSSQQLGTVLRRQVESQHHDRAQVQAAVGHSAKDRRETGRCPCGVDTLERRLFGELELMDTIRVHRRMRRRHVELSRVELGNVREENCGAGAIACYGRGEVARQGGVGNVGQRVLAHVR